MSNLIRTALVLILLFIGSAFRVEACDCVFGGGAVCQDYWQTSAVFAGTVIDSRVVVIKQDGYETHQRLVRLSVDEAFRGVDAGEVEIRTGLGDADCGFAFKQSERYLVYAREFQGNLTTSFCSRTKKLATANADLEYIRALKDSKTAGTIYGQVEVYDTKETGERFTKPVAGATILIDGPARKEVLTDKTGAYRLKGLPAGEYTVTISPLKNMSTGQTEQKVNVSNGGCAVVSFFMENDGRLSGRVLNQYGLPINNAELFLFDADQEKYNGHWESAYSDKSGNYAFQRIPRGRYVLTIRFDGMTSQNRPFPLMYYPGVFEREQAKVITIGEGQAILNYDLEMPALPREVEISGFVIWPNGQPAIGARVGYSMDAIFYDAKADATAKFSFKAYEGLRLAMRASMQKEPGKEVYSEWVQLTVTPNIPPVKITIPQPQ